MGNCNGVHRPALVASHACIEQTDGAPTRGELVWCVECGALRAMRDGKPIGPWALPGSVPMRTDFERLQQSDARRGVPALEVE
jgi:hypothetical protein